MEPYTYIMGVIDEVNESQGDDGGGGLADYDQNKIISSFLQRQSALVVSSHLNMYLHQFPRSALTKYHTIGGGGT